MYKKRSYFKEYRKSPRGKYNYYKEEAKKRKIQWNLTFKEFMKFWQKPCYYCGEKIETIGLDRIDSRKGYSLENLVPCCRKCNSFKGRKKQEFFITQCIKIAEHWKKKRNQFKL